MPESSEEEGKTTNLAIKEVEKLVKLLQAQPKDCLFSIYFFIAIKFEPYFLSSVEIQCNTDHRYKKLRRAV